MKIQLRLKDKKLVEDLHELKRFLNESKKFETAIEEVHSWIKHNYKDDSLAEKIAECKDSEQAHYYINEKLQDNLARKLRILEEQARRNEPSRRIPSLHPKTILNQPREDMINRMKEVHNL
jgi:uncharacterized protein HemY